MAITRERFTEGSTGFIRAQIVDQASDPVDHTMLTDGRLTLWDVETGSFEGSPTEGIINDRDNQDIVDGASSPPDLNDVEYDADGYFQWNLQPEDNVIINPRRQIERHRAMFTFEWDGGQFNYEIEIEVVNLRRAG